MKDKASPLGAGVRGGPIRFHYRHRLGLLDKQNVARRDSGDRLTPGGVFIARYLQAHPGSTFAEIESEVEWLFPSENGRHLRACTAPREEEPFGRCDCFEYAELAFRDRLRLRASIESPTPARPSGWAGRAVLLGSIVLGIFLVFWWPRVAAWLR